MQWVKRYPVILNLILAFVIAILSGLWVSYYTSTANMEMSDQRHMLLVGAFVFLLIQILYNFYDKHSDKRIINDLLEIGIRFFITHAINKNISPQNIRAVVHVCELIRPGDKLEKQRCLVPKYWKSPVPLSDFGAIPLDKESFKKWYVNVRVFHEQKVICDEPMLSNKPVAEGHYVSTPSLFSAKSVISAPIWSRTSNPKVIGTLTIDSVMSLEEMNWCIEDCVNDGTRDMLGILANSIGRILTNQ